MEIVESPTKQCLFCAETIQAAAIKCRYCGEFLNTKRARAVAAGQDPDTQPADDTEKPDDILFEANPSLWGMAGWIMKGSFFLALAVFLITFPLEYSSLLGLVEESAVTFAGYRITVGLALLIIVLLLLFLKTLKLKMTHYQISADRIEWTRGIFDRKVDNIDMFRVVDLKMRRSLLDCIVGIGTVGLITSDKTDPEFTFQKIRNPRELYNIIKEASLDADQKQRVIHLE